MEDLNIHQEVSYKGEQWSYSPRLYWHIENEELSNAGIYRFNERSTTKQQKRIGVSLSLEEITKWKS